MGEEERPCCTEPLFHGCIPALVTPFLTGEAKGVNVDVAKAMVKMHIENGASGFYVCGNTGEGDEMTVDERKAMTEACLEVSGETPCMIHVGACSVEDACELAKHAKEKNAAAISSMPPKDCDVEGIVAYFTAVGGASDLPFYVYWVPSGISNMLARDFLVAMKDVPNMAGIKYTDKDFFKFQQLQALAKEVLGRNLNCLTGPDEMMCGGLAMGSDGAIGSTYNILVKLNSKMYKLFKEGKNSEATAYQTKCNAVIDLLLDKCKIYESGNGLQIRSGLKAVLTHNGFDCGHARNFELTQPQKDDLIAAIEKLPFADEFMIKKA